MVILYSCTLTHNCESEIKILEYTIVAIFWLYYRSMTVIYIINKNCIFTYV
jgi:hypothetical protein